MAAQIHHREKTCTLRPSSTPVTTIAASETYIGRIVSPDRVTRSRIRERSRSRRIRYRTVIDAPWVPSSARTDATWRKINHWKDIARRIAVRRCASEGFVARADEERADLALLDATVDQLPIEADRAELTPAPRAELVPRVEGCRAPRALRHLDRPARLQPGIGERVHVALPVVPLDVLVVLD